MDSSSYEKYREHVKQITQGDDRIADMILFEAGRNHSISKIASHPFLYHGLLAVITNVLFPIKGLRRKVRLSSEDDFVLVSCPDPIFRTKTIGLIAGDLKYSIIYLPSFHITTSFKYHRFFKENGINALFPTIKLRHVNEAHRKVSSFSKQCGESRNNVDFRRLLSALSMYLIYDGVVKDYLKDNDGFQGKWILEHDKYYFMSAVANLKKKRIKSTMLQHGVFFRPSYNYIPLFCDKVLCCSEREKRIYAKNGVELDRVIVFGAPLQTLQLKSENRSSSDIKYDLLLLMTSVIINRDMMVEVLNYLKREHASVLVRLRPRSRDNDEKILHDALEGVTISPVGTPLSDDIMLCRKVVSFSEDANVDIISYNKPFIYVSTLEEQKHSGLDGCATEENYRDEINKLLTMDFYSTFSKEKYKEILGETDVDMLRLKFSDYILNDYI